MVVGLEVHVQLKTRTKAFCGCSTDFGAPPNANTCPVCLALPGALPVLNERAVELAIRAALALGCTVQPRLDLRAQELLLSRPAQGLSDLAVRPAARHGRDRRDRRDGDGGADHDRHHARAHGGGRGQVDPRPLSGRDRDRSQSRRRAAHRDRQRARHALRRRRPARTSARSSRSSSTST